MQRAAHNTDELHTDLGTKFHITRHGGIGEGLFDGIAGFDAMAP